MTTTPLTDYLERDHEEIDRLLDRAEGGGHTFDPEAFAQFRARLLRHIAIEEKVLLPAAARARGESLALARRMRIEHGAITTLLVPTPDLALIRELRILLEPHNDWEVEPGGVYEECQRALGESWPQVLEQMRAYPAVKVARHVDRPGMPRTAAEAQRKAARIR